MRKVPAMIVLPAAILTALPSMAVEYATETEARRSMFPEADAFVDASVALSKEQRREIEKLSGQRQRWETQVVRRAEKGGKTIGWFLVDEVVGKHDYITYAVGLTPGGAVVGVDVLVYRETYGYQIHEPEWRANFRGKTRSDSLRLNKAIPNITGATLSCRNVTDGIRRLLALYAVALADAH